MLSYDAVKLQRAGGILNKMQVWGSASNRVMAVYAWQTGFRDYYRQALEDLGNRKSSFDALAITGYFDCDQAAGNRHVSL